MSGAARERQHGNGNGAAGHERVRLVEWPSPDDMREALREFSQRLQEVEQTIAELLRDDERESAEVWGKLGEIEVDVKALKAWGGVS